MTWESFNVRNKLSSLLGRSRAADAFAYSDRLAGNMALKRSKDQLGLFVWIDDVKSAPVDFARGRWQGSKGVIEQR